MAARDGPGGTVTDAADHPPAPADLRSTVSWNAVLRSSPPRRALTLYAREMLRSPAAPNKFTFTFLIKACLRASAPGLAPHLHCHLAKLGLSSDPFLQSALMAAYAAAARLPAVLQLYSHGARGDPVVQTALVSAYAKCGLPDQAHRVFDNMTAANSVTWAAVVSGYAQSGRDAEALGVFRRMRLAGVEPTEACMISVLSASARLGALEEGRWVHRHISRCGARLTPSLGTALLTMYARCGCLDSAVRVFDDMPQRDRQAWAAMISAMAAHGQAGRALHLFDDMVGRGLLPDGVTYVGVLSACSHAGLTGEACRHFQRMTEVYNIAPGLEHYGCMVDVLGRAGRVEAAWGMVQSMPVEPDEFVLKSLLSACCGHGGYMGYAEWAAGKLTGIDAGHAGSYVLLSNAYASMGRWEDSARVRKLMRRRGVPKAPGSSLAEQ
uniref:Pentatricopeptide repeat-containing protein At4g37380, chloroplastic n=1 Tax=Anthurium amnicola TaxID=1678845 RepID=A0A1D1Y0Y4_9ARAE